MIAFNKITSTSITRKIEKKYLEDEVKGTPYQEDNVTLKERVDSLLSIISAGTLGGFFLAISLGIAVFLFQEAGLKNEVLEIGFFLGFTPMLASLLLTIKLIPICFRQYEWIKTKPPYTVFAKKHETFYNIEYITVYLIAALASLYAIPFVIH